MSRNKPPAFQFYTKEWLSSASVRLMPLAARGLLVDLLAREWEDGGVPDDSVIVARLVSSDISEVKLVWSQVRAKFELGEDGLLRNARLERLREEHARFVQSGKRGNERRWGRYACDRCGARFSAQQAFAGHRGHCAVGDAVANEAVHERSTLDPTALATRNGKPQPDNGLPSIASPTDNPDGLLLPSASDSALDLGNRGNTDLGLDHRYEKDSETKSDSSHDIEPPPPVVLDAMGGLSVAMVERSNDVPPVMTDEERVQMVRDLMAEGEDRSATNPRSTSIPKDQDSQHALVLRFLLRHYPPQQPGAGPAVFVNAWMDRIPLSRLAAAVRELERSTYPEKPGHRGVRRWDQLEPAGQKRIIQACLNSMLRQHEPATARTESTTPMGSPRQCPG